MKKYLFIINLVVIALAAGFLGCQTESKGQQVQEKARQEISKKGSFVNIDVKTAFNKIKNDSNVVVIDVRTPGEFTGELGHIPGAILRPVQTIDQWANEAKKLREQNKKIVLVCRSGNRSGVAARTLAEMGLDSLFNVQGGMRAWNAAGLPVEK